MKYFFALFMTLCFVGISSADEFYRTLFSATKLDLDNGKLELVFSFPRRRDNERFFICKVRDSKVVSSVERKAIEVEEINQLIAKRLSNLQKENYFYLFGSTKNKDGAFYIKMCPIDDANNVSILFEAADGAPCKVVFAEPAFLTFLEKERKRKLARPPGVK